MGSPSDPVTTPSNDGIATTVRKDKSKVAITRRPKNCVNGDILRPYISGYVDGEGCFSVSLSRRSKMLMGYEVRPSFAVAQNSDRARVLYLMKEYFKCGSIRKDSSDKTLKYEVRSLTDLVRNIIPHFEEYPLLSEKHESFLLFRSIVVDMVSGKHLSVSHFDSIFERAVRINSGKRKYSFGKI